MPTNTLDYLVYIRGFMVSATSTANVWANAFDIVWMNNTSYQLRVKTYPAWQTFYTQYLSFTIIFYWKAKSYLWENYVK